MTSAAPTEPPSPTEPPAGVPATRPPSPPAPRFRLRPRLVRFFRELPGPFSKVPTDTDDPTGLLSPRGRWEIVGLLGGLALGLAIGLFMVLFYMEQHAVPPGTDPGEWIAGSYAFVGAPFPSWYANSSSPPLMFPLLGAVVALAGGPIAGAHAFTVVEATLLGGSTYVLARALTRHPVTSLLITAGFLMDPTIDSLFFSGAYQYVFSFVLMNLTVAYLVMFIRSHRTYHLALFWTCACLGLLSHPAMLVEIPGMIAIVGIVLLWLRQIPREVVTTWTGRLGAAAFVLTLGGWYYLVPKLIGVHQNAFLLANGYFVVVQSTIDVVFTTVIAPFYGPFALSPVTTIQYFLLLLGLAVLGIVLLRLLRPTWLTLPWLAVIVWGTLQIACAYVGYRLRIVTPYTRFGDLLVLPLVLAGGMAIEGTVAWASTIVESGAVGPSGRPRFHRRVWRRIRTSPRLGLILPAVIVVGALVALGFYVDLQVAPNFQRLETADATVDHNASLLQMLNYINTSSVSGSILTVNKVVSWSRAITHRNVLAPFVPGYAINVPHILLEEETGFALSDRYAVTNSYVALAASGYYAPNTTALPLYEASYFGLFFPVLRVLPSALVVNESGVLVPAFTAASVPQYVLPAADGSSYDINLTARGVNVSLLVTAVPGTSSGTITIFANATGTANLTGLSAGLRPGFDSKAWANETGTPGSFTWNPVTPYPGYGTTFGSVTPASALLPSTARNASNASGTGLNLSVVPSKSTRELSVSIQLSSPESTNFVDDLPTFLSTTAIWSSLDATLFIYEPSTAAPQYTEPGVVPWLENEFGVRLLWMSPDNEWQIYLLPTTPLGAPT